MSLTLLRKQQKHAIDQMDSTTVKAELRVIAREIEEKRAKLLANPDDELLQEELKADNKRRDYLVDRYTLVRKNKHGIVMT